MLLLCSLTICGCGHDFVNEVLGVVVFCVKKTFCCLSLWSRGFLLVCSSLTSCSTGTSTSVIVVVFCTSCGSSISTSTSTSTLH